VFFVLQQVIPEFRTSQSVFENIKFGGIRMENLAFSAQFANLVEAVGDRVGMGKKISISTAEERGSRESARFPGDC
jgi:hypothetical protein